MLLSPTIGKLKLDGPLVLAPMAGVTDSAFRRMCRQMGASLVFTEMISADGLVRRNRRTLEYLEFGRDERPIGVQLFGSDPATLADAAALVAESYHPDLIDLNCGCPVRKVISRKAGSALLLDLPLLKDIVAAMAAAVRIPVTVKIRSGWKDGDDLAIKAALTAQDGGASAVTLHARHASAGFSGAADWRAIRTVKSALEVPVIGNGGVVEPADALNLLEETGCDAVMIARGAMGNPWIFSRAAALLADGAQEPPPTLAQRLEGFISHARSLSRTKGELRAVKYMRKQAGWYTKGFKGSVALRRRINCCTTLAEVQDAVSSMPVAGGFQAGETPCDRCHGWA